LETTAATHFSLKVWKQIPLGFCDTKQSVPVADKMLELACPALLFCSLEGLSCPVERPEWGNRQPCYSIWGEGHPYVTGLSAQRPPHLLDLLLHFQILAFQENRGTVKGNSHSLSWTIPFCHFCS